jgi:hypothetical protein
MLDFWLRFLAVALGPGELAFAATAGPTFTFGAVPVVVCDWATPSASNPAPAISATRNTDFFMCSSRNSSLIEVNANLPRGYAISMASWRPTFIVKANGSWWLFSGLSSKVTMSALDGPHLPERGISDQF